MGIIDSGGYIKRVGRGAVTEMTATPVSVAASKSSLLHPLTPVTFLLRYLPL